MGELRVQPGSLEAAGGSLMAAGEQVSAMGDVVATAGAVSSATGDAAAGEAYTRMCGVWAQELEHVGTRVTAVGRIAGIAARVYREVDEAVMPLLGGD
jgi:hypothetical protein